jgi:hypothetical protein
VESVPYPLLAVVQDLHEQLQRHSLSGPFRHGLFHDPQGPAAGWPRPVEQRGPALELLLRGAGCLLANGLAPAALPLLRELLPLLRELDTALSGPPAPGVEQYYGLLERELALGLAGGAGPRAYYLCGELLALYLDLLCVARPELHGTLGVQVMALRRQLHAQRQAGEAGPAG